MVERPTPRKSKLNARWRSKRRTKSSQRTTAFQKVLLLGRSDVSDPLWLFDTSRYQLITTDNRFRLPVCPVEPTLSGDYVIGSCTSVCSSRDRTWFSMDSVPLSNAIISSIIAFCYKCRPYNTNTFLCRQRARDAPRGAATRTR